MTRQVFACAVAAALASTAAADFLGVDLRTDSSWNSAANSVITESNDFTVVRLYAVFDSADMTDEILTVSQLDQGSLDLQFGRSLFQEQVAGGNTAPTSGLFGAFPAAQWDSYVSVGAVSVPAGNDPTSLDPDFGFVDTDLDTLDDSVRGGWFITGFPQQAVPSFNSGTGNFEVFLAQFTVRGLTEGDFFTSGVGMNVTNPFLSGDIAIITRPEMQGQIPTERVVTFTAVPSPGAAAPLAALGFLGAARRRRRA